MPVVVDDLGKSMRDGNCYLSGFINETPIKLDSTFTNIVQPCLHGRLWDGNIKFPVSVEEIGDHVNLKHFYTNTITGHQIWGGHCVKCGNDIIYRVEVG